MATREELEAKAKAEYERLKGRVVKIKAINGFTERDDTESVGLDSPIRVRIDKTDDSDIVRWMDDYLDPCYSVTLIDDPHNVLRGMRSFWCYGTSYSLRTGGSEPGDIVEEGGRVSAEYTYSDGPWTLEWEDIGEGYSGDYDPNDPNDKPLLRATMLFDNEPVDSGSYCTLAPAKTPPARLEVCSRDLFAQLERGDGKMPATADGFRRGAMEEWTWRTKP